MNFLDVMIVLATLLGLLIGWKIRAINLAFLILAAIFGILAANHFSPQMLGSFESFSPFTARILAWLVPFTITSILLLLLGGFLSSFCESLQLRWLDRGLGALIAGAIILIPVALGLDTLSSRVSSQPPQWLSRSVLAAPLLHYARPAILEGQKIWFGQTQQPKR